MRSARLELRVEPELMARIDAACGDVPRSRWVERAIEAALAVKDPVIETSAGPRARSSFRPGEAVEVPEFPPREVQVPPEVPYELPKIAKRKW